ncbi:MAG TPA: hypothetical protein DCM28_00395 [Phycisphaerales bacterium]|nr:hypothetical protein [Phycisphaerales bacterium]HCD30767.1 hypothetical protein [Phycisphaerales bacterium]|tara:strand:+ start:348 stop:1655 length:1308 start_codon:yes stop_codon:yes gene_type:complete
MKAVFVWMKNNPIAVVAALLSVCSLVGLLVVRIQASGFIKEMKARNSVVQQIKTLKTTRVRIPSPDLDNPVEERDITINPAAIVALNEVYHKMGIEYKNIYALAVGQNRKGHDPLLDGLFPDPAQRVDKLYDARVQYLNAFESMLLHYSATDIYPRLNAGGPADLQQVSREVVREQINFLSRIGLDNASIDQLTVEQQKQFKDAQRGAALQALNQHASKYHIYVDTPALPASIFQIGAWSNPGFQPEISQIWQGQMELWIQQDIVEAIGKANNVWDANYNIMKNPVKKLISMSVKPGYVGIDTTGVLTTRGRLTPGAPPSGQTRLPNGFLMTPTGRRSNSIYDVMHAEVSFIVDYQQLTRVFEAFGKTNFMTILKTNLTDVDEYEAMQAGFYYGAGDCVQIDMVVETLWLRDWTLRLMPKRIKTRLSIDAPQENQ